MAIPQLRRGAGVVIYAGMPRTSSTYLFTVLQKHPRAFLPSLKELNQFLTVNFHPDRLSIYDHGFRGARPDQVLFDISPPYFLEPSCAARIRAVLPEARVILSLRDPIEYVFSFYRQFQSLDPDLVPFQDFLAGAYTFEKFGTRIRFGDNALVDAVDAFREAFQENLLLVSYEEYREDYLQLLHTIERFAGLDSVLEEGHLPRYRINASGRPASNRLNRALFSPRSKFLASRLLPRSWIHRLGRGFNRMTGVRAVSSRPSPDDVALARELLQEQSAQFERILAESATSLSAAEL